MKQFAIAFFLLIFYSVIFLNANADVRLPALIGNHMVLQQNTEVNLWGWSEPSEKIKINTNWDTITYNTKGSSGAKWNIKIKTPAAGGPYTITITGYNKITVEDVMIGEVWDCSGQSNMEMSYSWGVKQYASDVASAANKSIRFFHIPKLTATDPQDDTKGSWVVCDSTELKTFSLAGYFFGQKIQQALSVPVGLIEASWGGTPAEVWTPVDAVETNPVLKKAADSLKATDWWPVKPASTYNAMIHPIINYTIAGVIWYQGEANVGTSSTYYQLFSTMINSWRKVWNINFPFYFVQIASFNYGNDISAAILKEAQTKTLSVPNTGMVVVDDLVADINNIHPIDKKDVGIRLANLALSETYGKKDIVYKFPMYKNMQVDKGKIKINFINADNGFINKGDTVKGFYIAGADKIFHPAMAKISGNNIIVFNKNIKDPVAVRFDFTNSSIPTLFSKEGLPVNLFRSDDWDDVNTTNNK